jgi:hypothetical protein
MVNLHFSIFAQSEGGIIHDYLKRGVLRDDMTGGGRSNDFLGKIKIGYWKLGLCLFQQSITLLFQ